MYNFLNFIIISLLVLLTLLILLAGALLSVIILGAADDKTVKAISSAPVIIPGCKINGGRVGKTLKERLDAAVPYLCSHEKALCVVCGGQYGKFTQAEVMKKYLVSKGIDKSRILVDKCSKTTFENMRNAYNLLKKQENFNGQVYIATQNYHLYRSKFYAMKFSMKPKSVIAKTPASQIWFAYPREFTAILKAWIKGK